MNESKNPNETRDSADETRDSAKLNGSLVSGLTPSPVDPMNIVKLILKGLIRVFGKTKKTNK